LKQLVSFIANHLREKAKMRHFNGNSLWPVLAVVGLPMLLTLLIESFYVSFLEPEPAKQSSAVIWIIRLCGLGLTVHCAMAGFRSWKNRLGRQVDALIEQCHAISLSEPISYRPPQLNLPDLARLELAIMVMRDVLLDYLVIYRRFFEAAPDMFLSLTPAGRRIQDANQSFFTKLGLLKSEVLGQPVEKFVALDLGWDHAMMDQGKLQKGCLVTEHAEIKIEVNLSWERRTQGQPWILGARISDVTEREHLMNQLMNKSTALEKALDEARSVEKLKDEFLTTLSHEIKTRWFHSKAFCS
jgi:two-component system phosphate regulon sensor histidine kinase PhoR